MSGSIAQTRHFARRDLQGPHQHPWPGAALDRLEGALDLAAFEHGIGLADADQASAAKAKGENEQGSAKCDRRRRRGSDLPGHRLIPLSQPRQDAHPANSSRRLMAVQYTTRRIQNPGPSNVVVSSCQGSSGFSCRSLDLKGAAQGEQISRGNVPVE
jgi:hypothetical protein